MDHGAHQPEQSEAGRRVAFFGGSFDPPHLGHLAIARAAQAALALDTVLFAPVGAQPLKPSGSTAAFAHRLAMTRLAIADEPAFALSLADAPQPSGAPNYTLETLLKLRAELPPRGELFCLMGADSFAALRRWHRAAEIPFAAALIVASRPGESLEDLEAALPVGLTIRQSLEKCLNLGEIPEEDSAGAKAHPLLSGVSGTTKVVPCYKTGLLSSDSVDSLSAEEKREIEGKIPRGLKPKASTDGILARLKSCPFKDQIQLRRYILRNPAGKQAPFYLLPNLEIEISASEIRRHIHAAGQSPLLPAPVLEYIRAHGLYRDLPRPN